MGHAMDTRQHTSKRHLSDRITHVPLPPPGTGRGKNKDSNNFLLPSSVSRRTAVRGKKLCVSTLLPARRFGQAVRKNVGETLRFRDRLGLQGGMGEACRQVCSVDEIGTGERRRGWSVALSIG